jgi:hypothetical protein
MSHRWATNEVIKRTAAQDQVIIILSSSGNTKTTIWCHCAISNPKPEHPNEPSPLVHVYEAEYVAQH